MSLLFGCDGDDIADELALEELLIEDRPICVNVSEIKKNLNLEEILVS